MVHHQLMSPVRNPNFSRVQIKQSDRQTTICIIPPSKHFIFTFGKGKRHHKLKSIGTDPLKILLACAFKTFLAQDRIILPVLLEWEDTCSMLSGDIKESWLEGCLKWSPKLHIIDWMFGASAILHRCHSHFFLLSPMTMILVTRICFWVDGDH